ncbi:DUF3090 family protein [Propionicicella superfundia]|uniref:DUF3090 family protein n=1 Tax=Propionicicella superfundia TaxID=348582 RepID=UPI0003F8BF77|nr:DUF3090 family protein [Propionicicella superfundia]
MARITHRLEQPDRFVAGTIGRPGERTFYMQARQGNRLVSVVCEKEQVQILAEHLNRLMDQISLVVEDVGDPGTLPEAVDAEPLDLPLMADFRVGTMSIAWDIAARRIQVELFATDATDEDVAEEEADGESLVVQLPMEMGREFVARALALVRAGRPPCPLCGQPLDAEGHVCPRLNGYRAL